MQISGRDILISLLIITIIIFINTKHKNKRDVFLYAIGVILFSLTMVIIFSLTGISPMSGFHIDIMLDEISFIPFKGILEMLQGGINTYAIINILGNIIMFMPIGFLAPLLWIELGSFKKIVLLGFGTSLLIEITQLFLVRGTDIDDLMLNTIGTLLGYLVFITFKNLFPKFSKKIILQSKSMENKFMLWACILVPYISIIIAGFYDRYMF